MYTFFFAVILHFSERTVSDHIHVTGELLGCDEELPLHEAEHLVLEVVYLAGGYSAHFCVVRVRVVDVVEEFGCQCQRGEH